MKSQVKEIASIKIVAGMVRNDRSIVYQAGRGGVEGRKPRERMRTKRTKRAQMMTRRKKRKSLVVSIPRRERKGLEFPLSYLKNRAVKRKIRMISERRSRG
jgi:hypothetical protein